MKENYIYMYTLYIYDDESDERVDHVKKHHIVIPEQEVTSQLTDLKSSAIIWWSVAVRPWPCRRWQFEGTVVSNVPNERTIGVLGSCETCTCLTYLFQAYGVNSQSSGNLTASLWMRPLINCRHFMSSSSCSNFSASDRPRSLCEILTHNHQHNSHCNHYCLAKATDQDHKQKCPDAWWHSASLRHWTQTT